MDKKPKFTSLFAFIFRQNVLSFCSTKTLSTDNWTGLYFDQILWAQDQATITSAIATSIANILKLCIVLQTVL